MESKRSQPNQSPRFRYARSWMSGWKQMEGHYLCPPRWLSRYGFVICHPESFPRQFVRSDFRPLFQIRQTVVYERKEAE